MASPTLTIVSHRFPGHMPATCLRRRLRTHPWGPRNHSCICSDFIARVSWQSPLDSDSLAFRRLGRGLIWIRVLHVCQCPCVCFGHLTLASAFEVPDIDADEPVQVSMSRYPSWACLVIRHSQLSCLGVSGSGVVFVFRPPVFAGYAWFFRT